MNMRPHRVPFGATILDAKYCELCGRNFLRRAQSDDRYCSKCLSTILTVNAQMAEKPVSKLIH
jgi:ribosomal protein L37AE/L43A